MGRCAKRFKKLEQEQHDQPQPDTVENEKWLSNAGLDLKLLEAAIEKQQQPDTVSKELEHNSQLLEELVHYQNARFNASEKKWNDIDEKEIKAGKFKNNTFVSSCAYSFHSQITREEYIRHDFKATTKRYIIQLIHYRIRHDPFTSIGIILSRHITTS